MFNSSEYFNPGYKGRVICEKTYFHSSIISATTAPLIHQVEEYDDIFQGFKQYTRLDFNKTFFEDMRIMQPDYLIVDLYADVIKDVLFTGPDIAITVSPIIEKSEIMNDLPCYKRLTHQDNNAYFEVFKQYLEQFQKELLSFFPETQIILNHGHFTKFYRKDGAIVVYDTPEIINSYNVFWTKLNQHFLSVFPKAKQLDMRNSGYMGDSNYPFGHSISHYESGYYKELYKQLLSIID